MMSTTRRHFVKAASLAPALMSALGKSAQAEPGAPQSPRPPAAERYDYVVAGGGHNSLICAAYLSKAGLPCPGAGSPGSDRRRLPQLTTTCWQAFTRIGARAFTG